MSSIFKTDFRLSTLRAVVVLASILMQSGVASISLGAVGDNVRPIDPRDFTRITISDTTHKDEPIRLADERRFVDIDSKIFIDFDVDSLIATADFVGNVSIAAKINDRKIEVAPYTEVGQAASRIGVSSRSPSVFSLALFQFIKTASMMKIQADIYGNYFLDEEQTLGVELERFDAKRVDVLKDVISVSHSDSSQTIDFTNNQGIFRELVNVAAQTSLYYAAIHDSMKVGDLYRVLDLIKTELAGTDIPKLSEAQILDRGFKSARAQSKAWEKFDADIVMLLKYIALFNNSDPQTRIAFSLVIERDPVFIRDISETLNRDGTAILSAFDKDSVVGVDSVDKLYQYLAGLNASRRRVIEVCNELEIIGGRLIKNTERERIHSLEELSSSTDSPGSTVTDSLAIVNLWSEPSNIYTGYLMEDSEQVLVNYLRLKAAEKLYQKLVRATIDLTKNDAKEGDRLEISLLWFGSSQYTGGSWGPEDDDRETSDEPLVLPLATFRLKKTGWDTNVVDSFLLVRRGEDSTADPNRSPSNYKGAPGVSLMMTYSSNEPRAWSFPGSLQPSFGLNVSYLDFDTTKDVEIGVGAIVGLFRNRVFLGGGRNLNVSERRPYYFLGFSFLNIASKYQE